MDLDVCSVCSAELDRFERLCHASLFDLKGVLPSEMLFLCSLARHLKVEAVVESGRARGVSTALIASFFQDEGLPVYSVENTRFSEDAIIATRRLKGFRNLRMIYGDAFVRLPALAGRHASSAVFIDGPKGRKAVLLAATLLRRHPSVKAVFIHDTYKGSEERTLLDRFFPENISSDEERFVERFRHLDDGCWAKTAAMGELSTVPYVQSGKPVASYGHTVSMLLNDARAAERERALYQSMGLGVDDFVYTPLQGFCREIKTYMPRKSYFQGLLKAPQD